MLPTCKSNTCKSPANIRISSQRLATTSPHWKVSYMWPPKSRLMLVVVISKFITQMTYLRDSCFWEKEIKYFVKYLLFCVSDFKYLCCSTIFHKWSLPSVITLGFVLVKTSQLRKEWWWYIHFLVPWDPGNRSCSRWVPEAYSQVWALVPFLAGKKEERSRKKYLEMKH